MTKKINNRDIIDLSLQWHVTTNCSNRCKHCYMYEEKTYLNERKNTLSLDGLIQILDNLEKFEKKYKAKFANLAITGGDPLLRADIFEFLQEIKNRKINIFILGNPETLTEKTVKKLKDLNISRFQMSLDGLEKTHDFFRSKGSFQRTIEKTKLLKEYDILCNIMFTLFPTNSIDLIPLMNFVVKNTAAKSFSFDVGCFVGEGKNLEKNFTPQDLQKNFLSYLKEKNRLEKEYDFSFHEKSNLHKITRLENDLLPPNFAFLTPVVSGCLIGWNPPSILSDGTALACRRFPLIVGKMPEDSFEDIFLKNLELKKYRRRAFFKGCKNCDLYSTCRGCPSNVHSLTKDPFAKNPLCFKKQTNKEEKSYFKEPGLNTTPQEEWDFIKKYHLFRNSHRKYLKNKDFQYIYLELAQDRNLKHAFLKNPKKFILDKKYSLTEDQIYYLIFRFGEKLIHRNYKIRQDNIAQKATENIIEDVFST